MKLDIRLLSGIEKKHKLPFAVRAGEGFVLEVKDETTIDSLIENHLGIELEHPAIGLVNGIREMGDYILKENDRIAITMPFSAQNGNYRKGALNFKE